MISAVKCQLCRQRPAEWAMQYLGEDRPTFYRLGWHARGFKVVKVCEQCRQAERAKHESDHSR